MTELLGNKLYVESLQRDVRDIHKVMGNLLSRLGEVNYTSWKYPDKLAVNVDINELLEMCDYDSDFEEENKISHLLLLELVIDRLIFFIQCSYRLMNQTGTSTRAQSAVDNQSSSVGVVTKKYWSKMVHFHSSVQQLQSNSQTQSRKIKELQSFNQELQDELSKYHQGATAIPTSSQYHPTNGSVLPPITQPTPPSIAKDNSNKASQTIETAFVPCEYCYKVQNSLKSVADSMSQLCKTQGLPCAIAKYRKQLKGIEWYSANDISRWSVEQNKDLDKINKHLEDLMNTINPLKEELADSISTCRSLEERVTECVKLIDLEKETQHAKERDHISRVNDLKQHHEEVQLDLEQQKAALELNKEAVEQRLKEVKCELELQKSKYTELDDIKQQLMIELEDSKTNNSEVKRLKTILAALEQDMTATQATLAATQAELSQEQALSKSVSKRTESLQAKYDSLVRRIDEMDEENNTLQTELSALMEEKEHLEMAMSQLKTEKQTQSVVESIEVEKVTLQNKIRHLEETVTKLEGNLKSMKEHERLLTEYPDLNGPINSNVAGTGDLVTDMSNQVKANQLRIDLLEKQNLTMKKTIDKLNQRQPTSPPASELHPPPTYNSVPPMKPTPLWNQNHSLVDESDPSRQLRPTSGKSKTGLSLVPEGDFTVARNSQIHENKSRLAQGDSTSMDAYRKLKKAGLLKTPTGTSRQRRTHGRTSDEHSYACPDCNKQYHTSTDLDLHRSYCAKR